MNSNSRETLNKMRLLGFWNASGPPSQRTEVFTDPALKHRHDWGVFGDYQYLGKGTPATRKTQLGVEPRDEIDRLAQEHDLMYVRTKDAAAGRSIVRGFVDYGAGSAMLLQSLNPWADVDSRTLGIIAGAGLIVQGVARLYPAKWSLLITGLGDLFFY